MYSSLKKELRAAGFFFGLIGFLIGLIQVGIVYLLQ
jgi:preprotein translocase subunit Sss1